MLKIEFKDKRSEPIWVVGKSFSIGSADDNNLVIDDPSVSPQHAKLLFQNGKFTVKDVGSNNGTYVNGQKVGQKAIACKDVLRFGDVDIDVLDPFDSEEAKSGKYWSLIASSSWLTGQEFPLRTMNNKPIVIGRGKKCDIMFPGTHLSRQHAEIEIKDGYLSIRDLQSANGTFINDKRVTEGKARPGDSVRLDVYNFKVFGPGFNLPRSTNSTASLPSLDFPEYENKNDNDKSPQWDIPPTSPGNRIEPENRRNSIGMIIFSTIILLALIATVYYLLFL